MIEERFESYRGNPLLKRKGTPIEWTPELIQEYIRCKNDVIYFCENYMKVVHVDRGLVPFELYKYQKEMVKSFYDYSYTVCCTARQAGKCLNYNSNITVKNNKTKEIFQTTLGKLYKDDNLERIPTFVGIDGRKFIESFKVYDYSILTDTGFEPISNLHKTIEYERWILKTASGKHIEAADDHLVFESDYKEIFVKDCIPNETRIITESGPELVVECYNTGLLEHMYDVTVESENHRFYSNGILSHNTTSICGFALHYMLFNEEKTIAILANKAETARMILGRIQKAYEHLPKWLQHGVTIWNKGSFEIENGSKILAGATSSDSIRGSSINVLIIDEAAHIQHGWDEFFTSTFPTISSGKSTKVILISTPCGLNHFYSIWDGAEKGTNGYNPIKVEWYDVPGRDEEWKKKTLQGMNNDLEKFQQEYSCSFIGSSGTLINGAALKNLSPATMLAYENDTTIYSYPDKDHTYVLTADVSEGKGLDYSVFQVIDITTMPYKQVCVYRTNLAPPAEFAESINRTAMFYNNAAVLIENNNSMGNEVGHLLFDLEYENIIYTESAGSKGKKVSNNPSKGERGIRTSISTKAKGCSILKLLIEQQQLIINDQDTIWELSRFSRKGRSYEAEDGATDDLVMALVQFAWLTADDYFKELTDINTVARLREKTEEELEEKMMLLGIFSPTEEMADNPYSIDIGHDAFDNWMLS